MAILTIAIVAVTVWTILLLPYVLWLSKTTFFYFQRAYLLTSILTGLGLGIYKALGLKISNAITLDILPYQLFNISQEIVINRANQAFDSGGFVSAIVSGPVFISIYLIISLGLIALLFYKIIELITMVRGNTASTIMGMTIVESPALHTPFSFFHLIFLSKERQLDRESLSTIIKHEAVHTRQMHSLDILLVELLFTFTWFFPVLFIYKKYLNKLHEYIADEIVVRDVPTQEYGLLLIAQRMGDGKPLTHNFAKSELKSRFQKMTQLPSNKLHLAGFLTFFPLLLFCGSMLNNLKLENLGKVITPEIPESEKITSREVYMTPQGELKVVPKETKYGDIYTPQYPGGMDELMNLFQENLHIPAHIDMKSEKIFAKLNFDEEGRIILITYMKPVDTDVEKALQKVFDAMPLWEIPTVNGKKHRTEITLPISFGN